MINTDTHILCEPYEYDLNKETLNIQEFIDMTAENIESINNTNYDKLDKYLDLDEEIKNSILDIDLPNSFRTKNINLIYQYSNKIEIDKLITMLDSKMSTIYNLKNNVTEEEINNKILEICNLTHEIKDGNCYNKSFSKFSEVTGTFDNVVEISNSEFFRSLIDWIVQFPYKLTLINVEKLNFVDDAENVDNSLKDKMKELKKKVIHSIYILYQSIIKNIIDTKLWWNRFLDMMNPDIEKPESYIDEDMNLDSIELCLNDLSDDENLDYLDDENEDDSDNDNDFDDDFDEVDEDSFDLGMEAGPKMEQIPGQKKNNPFAIIASFFKNFPNKVNKIRKQFKMYRMRAKNHAFYMKYMGRIEGLYERYSDDAVIIENIMKGDPVEILKDEAHEYILNTSNKFVDLEMGIIDTSKKFASMSDPKQMLVTLKSFGGMYMGDTKKASQIPKSFLKSIHFKVGQIITTNNKIYGYTPESIATNNKLPPSNHAIVSLFVDRMDEKPKEQKVSDIFKSPDSFKLISKNEKEPVFELSVVCSDLLTKGIQKEAIKQIKLNKKANKEKVLANLNELSKQDKNPKKAKKLLKNQYKACWKAIERSFFLILEYKSYIADLIQSYFVMMTRIDNLCKQCVVSMLHQETMHTDERYNKGFKADSVKAHKEYKQYEDNQKTKGEKWMEKQDKRLERNNAFSERQAQYMNRKIALKKAMRAHLF